MLIYRWLIHYSLAWTSLLQIIAFHSPAAKKRRVSPRAGAEERDDSGGQMTTTTTLHISSLDLDTPSSPPMTIGSSVLGDHEPTMRMSIADHAEGNEPASTTSSSKGSSSSSNGSDSGKSDTERRKEK